MVGANGFEPSTSWSRTRDKNDISRCPGVTYNFSGRSLLDKFGQVAIEELRSERTPVVVLRPSGAPILAGLPLHRSSSRAIASADDLASWKPATSAELTYFHWT
jgi:hypothetical protein